MNTRRRFIQALGIATVGLFLRLAPEKTLPFKQLELVIGIATCDWVVVGSKSLAVLGLSLIELKHGTTYVGECNGVPVYHSPWVPEWEVLTGWKTGEEF